LFVVRLVLPKPVLSLSKDGLSRGRRSQHQSPAWRRADIIRLIQDHERIGVVVEIHPRHQREIHIPTAEFVSGELVLDAPYEADNMIILICEL
jgi:hypothetical protein